MSRSDAEIFKRNVKRICKAKGMKMRYVDLEAGYGEKHTSEMAYKRCSITTEHIRAYARVLGVKPWKLTEGMFDEEHAEIFKQNIRILCEEQDITLIEATKRAGYHGNYLHYMTCRHIEPSDEAIRCYAKALGVKPERLTEGFYDN